ncbi:MAG: ATP-dependent metalloprotease, partial [Pseudomonadales bacterium]
DDEIKQIIDQCYSRARKILVDHREKLDAMAAALLEYETIDKSQIDDIMAGRPPKPPSDWNDDAPSKGPDLEDSAASNDDAADLDGAPSGA